MNLKLVVEGVIELILSLVTGFAVFFFSMKIFMLLTRGLDEFKELKKKNAAVAVVLVAFILALVLVVNQSVAPAMETLKTIFATEDAAAGFVVVAVVRIIAMYVISAAVALLLLWLGMSIYTGLTTRIDEMAELKKNNLAVGILFATFIFSAGFVCMGPLATLLKAFVPQIQPGNLALADKFISNPDCLIQGLIELPLAFLGTTFVYFIGVLLSDFMTGTINETAELKKNNVASAVYTASSLFSLMYLVKEAALTPLYDALDNLIVYSGETQGFTVSSVPEMWLTIALIPVFFVVTGVIALGLTRAAQAVFMLLTKNIDEMAEVKKNNAAVALILAALTIAIVILVTHGMTVLAQGFIPAPEVAPRGGLPVIRLK